MKYRSISLNGNKGRHYSLVKYNKWYQDYLIELNKMNNELAQLVLKYPSIYDESSSIQSYMIFQGEYNCVGAIIIDATNLENLKVKVQLNEKYFSSQQDIFEVVEQIVESLKLFFYDKKNIEINLLNDLDLSKIDCQNYHKAGSNLNIYNCSNEKNILIPKLIEEVICAEKKLTDWRQSWWQELENHELHYEFDRKLVSAIDNGTATYPELFSKFKTVVWRDIKSKKSTRCIIFSREGYVKFYKDSKQNGINYEFSYNVMSEGFKFKGNINDEDLTINDNKYFTEIKTKQLKIVQTKENNLKYINYVSPIVNNFSIAMDIWLNESNEIEKCNIDFRTHKGNGKINGIYIMRIDPHNIYNKIMIKFINRKGSRYNIFLNLDFNNEKDLLSTIIDEKISIDLINSLINKVINIINNKTRGYRNQSISDEFCKTISNIFEEEKQIVEFMKQIIDEIPLPHLRENLNIFLDKYYSFKEDAKRRTLKLN